MNWQWIEAQGVAYATTIDRPSRRWASRAREAPGADLVPLCPDLQFFTEWAPQTPVSSLPSKSVAEAIKSAGPLPAQRVLLRGTVFTKDAEREQWLRDSIGELRLALQDGPLPETGDPVEVAGFPTRSGGLGATFEGPMLTRLEAPLARALQNILEVHTLPAKEASQGLPVKLKAPWLASATGSIRVYSSRTIPVAALGRD